MISKVLENKLLNLDHSGSRYAVQGLVDSRAFRAVKARLDFSHFVYRNE